MRRVKVLKGDTERKAARPLRVLAIILGENLTAPPQEANGAVISFGVAGVNGHVPLGCGYSLFGHMINYQVTVTSYQTITLQCVGLSTHTHVFK